MKSFRFSPIRNKSELFKTIEYIHFEGHKLCKQCFGCLIPVAGNIGIFSHFEDEFNCLMDIRKELTDINNHWNQKYFRLFNPITIPAKNGVPKTIYTYLYIRKPDINRPEVGDVDFYLKPDKYKKLKKSVISGKFSKGVEIFNRPDLDLISLHYPDIDVLSFVGCYNLNKVVTNQSL